MAGATFGGDFIPYVPIDAERWPSFVVDREGHLIHVNPAWDRVAEQSNGPVGHQVLGTSWLSHVRGDELRVWYDDLFQRVMTPETRGERHVGDCNTPDRHRIFSTRYDPLKPRGTPMPAAMLVLTSLIVDTPIRDGYCVARANEQRYRQESGVILQCGGCRRVHVSGTRPRVWEFVPEYMVEPRRDISHGLCELCREVHYGIHTRKAS